MTRLAQWRKQDNPRMSGENRVGSRYHLLVLQIRVGFQVHNSRRLNARPELSGFERGAGSGQTHRVI